MSDFSNLDANQTAIRKAAILIATLEASTASALLARMPAEQAAQVKAGVSELETIPPEERDAVIRQFLQREASSGVPVGEGVELDAELARKLQSRPLSAEPPRDPAPERPFQALWAIRPQTLAHYLERQHPQVIALVIAHFPVENAAAVVELLSPRLQADVLRRVAELEGTDPEVVREVELELEQLFRHEIRAARQRSAGLSTVAAIVQAAGAKQEQLLSRIAAHDREFANQLAAATGPASTSATPRIDGAQQPQRMPASTQLPMHQPSPRPKSAIPAPSSAVSATSAEALSGPAPAVAMPTVAASAGPDELSRNWTSEATKSAMGKGEPESVDDMEPVWSFDELIQLSDDEWAELIRAAEPQVIFLSLAAADEKLVARITRQLPARDAREFQRRLERIGPVQLADIDRAQRRMLQHAAQLVAEKRIQRPGALKFAAAA